MTEGKPLALLVAFMIPTLVGGFLQQLNVSINAMIVGQHVGVHELAAIGASQGLNFLFISLLIGLSIGISVCISQYFGAKDEEKLKLGISTGLLLMTLGALSMAVLGIIFAYPLLRLVRTPYSLIHHAQTFLSILFIGILPQGVFNGYAAILRAFGNAKAPLMFQIFGAVVNVILSFLFIVVFDGGLIGSALANVVGQFAMALSIIVFAYTKVPYLKLKLKAYKLHSEPLKVMMKMGIPSSIQFSVMSLGNMAVQMIVNGFGMEVVAGATAAMTICMLAYQPAIAIGSSASIYTGQNVGAKKFDRIGDGMKASVLLIFLFSGVMTIGVHIFMTPLLSLFLDINNTVVLGVAQSYLRIVATFYVLFGLQFIFREIVRGTGDGMAPMKIGFAEVGMRLLFSVILSQLFDYHGVWLAIPTAWAIATGLAWLKYRKEEKLLKGGFYVNLTKKRHVQQNSA